ncbi:TetR/AcrR family transcriptional regulator [Enorma burkinafasonensis]|uniref:TetR/AcrR family transcriptional regulator n=1 Tax=Enorma burkinafasonensis TaxID=2590867 RepID=UPI0026EFA3F4|nr:TetR/AcrR family transcriptional regulator [Enorma burkinafasonensis]MCI7731472.1 TetR/AcrR family transcriptional regulator [Enorma burkinafasonensis]
MATSNELHGQRAARCSYDARRNEILQAVVDVCSEEGIGKLSISAVTKRVGCTRSLFYHYFPNKTVALEAALDYTIDMFIARLRSWNESRVFGDIEGALDSISALLKSLVLEMPGISGSITAGGDAVLYTAFVDRVAERCARYMCESTVVDFAAHHEVLIDNVYETFYVLISGLILFIRSHRDVSENVIKDIIACTLHIEGYTEKFSDRRPPR